MKRLRRGILVLIAAFGILLPGYLAAENLKTALDGVNPEAIRALEETGEAFRLDKEGRGILLLPDHPTSDAVRERHESLAPDVMVEALYVIPYPEGTNGIDLDVYNTARRISSLDGILYLSHRKQDYVPLFEKVYRVDESRARRRLEDPVVSEIPADDGFPFHMVTANLGAGYYNAHYLYDGENLSFSVENFSALRMLVRLVDRNDLRFDLIIRPVDEGFLVYGYCGVKLASKDMVFRMMDPYTGFYRRLYAIETWLYNSLHDTERKPELKTPLDF